MSMAPEMSAHGIVSVVIDRKDFGDFQTLRITGRNENGEHIVMTLFGEDDISLEVRKGKVKV